MLIEEDGTLTGAISGGCLEGDALRKALLVMNQEKAMLVTYDTMDDDDAKFGVGLGCNGIIQVLIEPILPSKDHNPIALLKLLLADRSDAVLVTLFSLENKKNEQPGTCLLKKAGKSITGTTGNDSLNKRLEADILRNLEGRTASFKNYISPDFNVTAFIEFVPPAVSLIIAGAGNDVIPVVDMATLLGWETTVFDGRPSLAKADRFINAGKVTVMNAENVMQNINLDERTIFLLMTHNYNYDFKLLGSLLRKETTYIGILGPKKKWDRIIDELEQMGVTLTDEQLSAIHSPVGLDIGAETPEEIALSIITEIKSVLSRKNAAQLKIKTERIHQHEDSAIEKIVL